MKRITYHEHNWNCKGHCRHNVQCELDARWQTLEEAIEHDEARRLENEEV